jgi:hypothetical protein
LRRLGNCRTDLQGLDGNVPQGAKKVKLGVDKPPILCYNTFRKEVNEMAWKELKVTFEAHILVPGEADESKAIQNLLANSELDDWLETIGYEVCKIGD